MSFNEVKKCSVQLESDEITILDSAEKIITKLQRKMEDENWEYFDYMTYDGEESYSLEDFEIMVDFLHAFRNIKSLS